MIAEHPWAGLAEPDRQLRACVVIPARDEEAELPATLAALAGQLDRRGRPLDPRSFEVIVLANNCSDRTAEVARRWPVEAGSGVVIRVVERSFAAGQAHVGTARKCLMDLACARLEFVDRPQGLIASTDADTRVAADWLAATLAEVAAGADAVAGVIGVEPVALRALGPRVRRAYWQDRVHRRLLLELEALLDPNPLDPFPRHDFHGGASFALTPAAYRRVGGLVPLPCLEDVALAEALWKVDARFVHSPRVRVRSSPRPVGRTQGGQSQAISGWADGPPCLVPGVAWAEAELRTRRRLRRCFEEKATGAAPRWQPDRDEVAALTDELGGDPTTLAGIMRREATFGGWLAAITRELPGWPGGATRNLVPIDEAIDGLRARVRGLRQTTQA